MRTKCVLCKKVLMAELTKITSFFDDFSDQWTQEMETREAGADGEYNSSVEEITDVWCPECGLKYKFHSKQ